ncbi:DUF4249 domain-containing protein [Saccharicrinis sp. FJH2]|uniref:DUF4249 domain-containing protein n=1 Tax=Saccharicrinis sp. FJH65 TaxID=3344659 RepID=UPI0035F2B12C
MKRVLYILFMAVLVSCTERIDIQIDKSYTRIVVDGSISNDPMEHLVRLTKSADFFDGTETPNVTDATVFILEGSDTVHLNEKEAGMYYTPKDFAAKFNTEYELVIQGVDINEDGEPEEYRAMDTMTYPVPIDSINLLRTYIEGPDHYFVGVMLFMLDPPEKNNYLFKSLVNGKPLPESVTDWGLYNDEFFNGNYTNGIVVKYLNQEDSTEMLKPGDVFTLQQIQISEAYYDFLQAVNIESFGNIPLFSGPPANIVGNVSNDGIGFFSCLAVSRASAKYNLPAVGGDTE